MSFRAKSRFRMKPLYSDLYAEADVELIAEDSGRENVRCQFVTRGQWRDVFFGSSVKFGPMVLKLQPERYQSNVNEMVLVRHGMEPYVASCLWIGYVDVGNTRYCALLHRREKALDELFKEICTFEPTEQLLHFLILSVFYQAVVLWRTILHLGFGFMDAGPMNLAWRDGRVFL